jgi:hypothetical protein
MAADLPPENRTTPNDRAVHSRVANKTPRLMSGKWWELGRDPHLAFGIRLASSRWA